MNLGIETETLEFKKSTGELKEAMHSICAILNKHQHGELYFGIKPDGTPIGQIVTEESLREVSQRIRNTIEPRIYPQVSIVNFDGRDCIYVKFEGTNTPYFSSGIAKIRVADEDLTMSPQELIDYINKNQSEENRWENQVSVKMIDDVDEELLRAYMNHAHEAGRLAIAFTDKKTVLDQLELIRGNFLLNAARVLFCDDIIQDIQMATFATEERLTFTDIQRKHGPVTKLVDIGETYIKNNIHWQVEFEGTMERKEIPEIPLPAIREALMNSFCHKDYSQGQSNEIAIYRDRVEIYNPGSFPEGYEPEDFIVRPERPIRRNPKIARILYYSKDIESFGTGLRRIAEACNDADVGYEFRNLKSGFVVVFYRNHKKPIKADKKPIKADNYGEMASQQAEGTKRRQLILSYIYEHGAVTNKEARELLGLAESTTKRLLKSMVEEQLLQVIGEKKNRQYVLGEEQI